MHILNKLSSKKSVAHTIIDKKIKTGTIMEVIFRSILFSGFIILIVYMIFMGYYIYQRNITYALTMLEEETKSNSTKLDQYFQDIITTIDVLSFSPELQKTTLTDENKEIITAVLAKIENNNNLINKIFIGYEGNTLLINDSIFPKTYNVKESTWYNKAIQTQNRSFSVGDYPSLEKSFNPKFMISKSISLAGKNIGVISVDCKLDSLYNLFSSTSMFKSKEVMLANATDQIILSETPDEIDKFILSGHSEMFTEEKNSFPIKFQDKKYQVFFHQLSDTDWSVISRISYSEITYPSIPHILILAFLLLIITFIIAKILAQVLGKTIAKPVIEVSFALKSLAKGHKDITPIKSYPQNEIGTMAESFNTFLETTKTLKSDINELNDAKNKLSYSISLLNASLESTEDGILIVTLDNKITKWNNKFLEVWQIREEDMKLNNTDLLELSIKPKVANFEEFKKTTSKIKDRPDNTSFNILELNDGRIVERYSFPQRVDNTIVGRVWRYRDITKIRNAEISLQNSEERFRNAITYAPYPIMIHSEGKVLQLSEEWTKQTGYTIDDIPTIEEWTLKAYGKDAIRSQDYIDKVYRIDKKQYDGELRVKIKDGSYRIFDFSTSPMQKLNNGKNIVISMASDITERKQAEDLLLENKNKLNLIINTAPFGMCTVDKHANFIMTNPAYEQMVGYTKEELSSLSFFDLTHPKYISENKKLFQEIFKLNSTGCFSMEKRYNRKDGKEIDVSIHAVAIKDTNSRAIFATAFVEDITERKQALEQIKMLSQMPAENPQPVFRVKHDGSLLYANDCSGKLLDAWNCSIGDKLPTFLCDLVADIFKKDTIKEVELKVKNQIFSMFIVPIVDRGILNIYGRDITEIRESEQKYRLLFENMTTGFALHEMIYNQAGEAIDYRYLDVNPAFEQLTASKSDQLIGKTVKEVFPKTEDYWIETYSKVAKTKKAISFEQYSQEFDRYFEVKAFSPGHNKFATIFSDITNRVKALKELENEKEIAQAATKTKSEFLANMSHEIRTPLNGVIGFTDLLLSTELTSSQKEFAVNANVSGKALLGIISDVLDFSKIEAGKMELEIVNHPINVVLEQAIDIIKFSACKKGLDVILDIPVDFPYSALIDPLRLKQILLNLLNNAVKFTKEGEIELSAKFIPFDKKHGKFIFKVRDTGVGIPEEASMKLFKAFSQADGSITRKYGGTGLGLVISNFFADKMGSHIDFVSQEGKGSEFYFTLETDYTEKSTNRKGALKGYKVLIADKNSLFLDVCSKRLRYWGLEVKIATNNDILHKYLSEPGLDAVLIDERLFSKFDLQKVNNMISKYKELHESTSIIITYCPNQNTEVINLSNKINADHMLTKPLIIDELFKCLQKACGNESTTQNKVEPAKLIIEQLQPDKKIKILIAEDVEMNMILIKTLVKKILPDVEIYEAKNGMEAVLYFRQHSPDLVLMDIQMPELDGLEATKAIKKLEKSKNTNTPIIALTAGAFADDKENCLMAGMVDFLTKPISIKELTIVLRKYLTN